MAERKSVTIVTDGSGDAIGYIDILIGGRVMSLHYVKTDYTNGVDFVITVEETGEGLWQEDSVDNAKSVYPRAGVHDIVGAVALRVAAGLPLVEPIYLANDRIKIVIANGGNTKTGKIIAIIG